MRTLLIAIFHTNSVLKRKQFLLLILCLIGINTFSQNTAEIKNIEIVINGKNLEISYFIESNNTNQSYFPIIEVYRNFGSQIQVSSYKNIPDQKSVFPGQNKILWESEKDGVIINENIYVVIKVLPDVKIPLGKHLVKSMVYPGWGNYRLGNSNFYFTYGLAGWGMMAGSVLLNQTAAANYDNYKLSYDPDKSNEYFNKAKSQQTLSYVCFGLGTAVWLADITGVIGRKNKVSKNISAETSNYYYNLSQLKTIGKSKSIYFDNRPEWKIAMENGDNKFINKQFADAKSYYQKALSLKPNDGYLVSRLKETEDEIEKNRLIDIAYAVAMAKGDSLLVLNDFIKAKESFQNAQNLRPERKEPRTQIKHCDNKLEEIRINTLYNDAIVKADSYFKQKKYDDAKQQYKEASAVKPSEVYPLSKLDEIKTIEAENEYNASYQSGLSAMKQGQFDNAKFYFETALKIKPNSSEARNMLIQVAQKIIEQEKAKADKEYKSLVDKANKAYFNNEFDEAKRLFYDAKRIKPAETYPQKRIDEIDELLSKKHKPTDSKEALAIAESAVFFLYSETWKNAGTGTGFFISPDGIAISNYHVYNSFAYGWIYTGTKDRIQTNDKSKYFEIEKIISQNEEMDYVIFKVKKSYSSQKFPYLKIAENKPEILDEVLAIGNPSPETEHEENSVLFLKMPSIGYVKQFQEDDFYIISDVDVTFGNSGGPLINMNGEVVGIMTMVEDNGRLGLNYAINIQKIPGISKYK